jgi:hypothetical protein
VRFDLLFLLEPVAAAQARHGQCALLGVYAYDRAELLIAAVHLTAPRTWCPKAAFPFSFHASQQRTSSGANGMPNRGIERLHEGIIVSADRTPERFSAQGRCLHRRYI